MDVLLFSELLAAAINGWMTAFLVARAPREPINRILSVWCLLMFWWALCFFLSQSLASADMRFLFRHFGFVGWVLAPTVFYQTVQLRIYGTSPRPAVVLSLYVLPVLLLLLQILPDVVLEPLAVTPLRWVSSEAAQTVVYDVNLALALLAAWIALLTASRRGVVRSPLRYLRPVIAALGTLFLAADAVRTWLMPELPPLTPLASGLAALVLLVRYGRTGHALLTAPSAAEEIVQIASYIILVYDVQGHIRTANPAAEQQLGYTADELHTMNVAQLLTWARPPDPDRYAIPGLAPQASTRATMNLRDGGSMPVVATEAVMWSELGNPVGVILIASDARELLAHEQERATLEALRESEARFRSLIENASDLISIVDFEGRLRYQSPSVERVLGYRVEEALARPVCERLHVDDVAHTREALERRQPASLSLRVQHKDGSWRWLEATANPIVHGGVEGMIINARDVTERQRLEAQLLQATKMEAVGRLAGGVAHDFNNMLTAIKGYTDLLLADPDVSSEAVRADLTQIRKAANQAAELTQQLLAFSRRQMMAPRTLDLNGIAADMESMLRRLIGEDIELIFRLDPALGAVRADLGQLQQVILNLALNARDAMPGGGCLTLETSNTGLHTEPMPPGDYVRLSLSDTGHGMSREVMSHIFEPFYTTKEAGKGTGLGLAMVYGIVKQSGGWISVDSTESVGSSFHVYLPRAAEPAEVVVAPPPKEHAHGTETVLLVEDEPDVRRVARRSLEQRGYRVLEADCGSRAIEMSDGHDGPVHILVTDVVMPQMSGIEVAEAILARRPGMIVLYMSGYTDQILAEWRLASADHFLAKPFTPAALQERVRRLLDNVGSPDGTSTEAAATDRRTT